MLSSAKAGWHTEHLTLAPPPPKHLSNFAGNQRAPSLRAIYPTFSSSCPCVVARGWVRLCCLGQIEGRNLPQTPAAFLQTPLQLRTAHTPWIPANAMHCVVPPQSVMACQGVLLLAQDLKEMLLELQAALAATFSRRSCLATSKAAPGATTSTL